jgi:hypothetical protein
VDWFESLNKPPVVMARTVSLEMTCTVDEPVVQLAPPLMEYLKDVPGEVDDNVT